MDNINDTLAGVLDPLGNLQYSGTGTVVKPVRIESEPFHPAITLSYVPDDTLFGNQWHLLNTGQGGGTPGIDINVTSVWDDYTGAGVRVGVVDDGIQYTHPDLNDNYNPSGQFDYGDNDTDPLPTAADPHGTAVAGLIAAENDGVGSVGVAFGAELTALRIFGGDVTSLEFADVYNRHAAELDVSNNSWGFNGFFYDNLDGSVFSVVGDAIENAAANGRDGLGTVMLWAAGNDRADGQNVNYHGFQAARETIAVAAITNQGHIAPYSTPGASILVGAPSNGGTVAITTTDQVGADGYSAGDYTSSFGGTSAATPITSGVVALVLEANPQLGYRDVQEILGYTARQVDASDPGWAFNGADNWNGGGLHTSHDFGFGLIDAHAAVRLAETWTAQSTAANEAVVSGFSAPNMAIVDNGSITDSIQVNTPIQIDYVEVALNLQHTWIGDLVVTLTSPDGTESILVDRPGVTSADQFGSDQDNIDFTLSSTHHWGEYGVDPGTGVGVWTLEVRDEAAGEVGTLVDWGLNLFGDLPDNNDTYIYTDEFAGFTGDAARQLLTDSGGIDTINAAAVTGDSVIDLNAGADSVLAENTLTIDAGTVIEDAYAGDGNDTLVGNAADNFLSGGRGDDTLEGGAGNDQLDGGTGDNLFVVDAANGSDVIGGFVAGAGTADKIDLSARADINDFASLMAVTSDNGADTTIAFGNGDLLVLTNVLKSALSADDFIIVDNTPPQVGLSPDQISGLNLWLDSSDGSTLVDSDGDGNVNAWLDKSGLGHDATSSGTQQPGVSGGVTFDGVNDVLGIADASDLNLSTYAEKTLVLAFTTGSDVDTQQVLYEQGGTIRGLNLYVGQGGVHLGGWNLAETSWGSDFVSAGVSANTTYVASLTFDATAGTLSGTLNGVSIGSVSGVDLLHAHTGDIGLGQMRQSAYFIDGSVTGDGFGFDGTIHEVAFFDRALNGTDRADLETFLTDKWGAGAPPPNTVPVATDDTAATFADQAVAIDVLANDSDPDGDSLSILQFGTAGNGTVAEDTGGNLVYTPDAGFLGSDSFDYTVSDGRGGEASATVTVTVQDAPPGLSPDQISGLNLWLDGSDGSTLVDSDGDGNVNAWLDKSGFGHTATSSGTQQPGVSGGATFDGANDVLGIADASDLNLSTYSEKTLVLAFTTGSDVAARQVLYEQGGAIRGLNLYVEQGEVHLGGWNLNTTEVMWGPDFVSAGVSANTTYVASLTFDATAGTLSGRLNGALIGNVSGVDLLHGHIGDIGLGAMREDSYFQDGGATGDGFGFGGAIHEAAFFDRALSSTEQTQLATFLSDKWGAGAPPPPPQGPEPRLNRIFP